MISLPDSAPVEWFGIYIRFDADGKEGRFADATADWLEKQAMD